MDAQNVPDSKGTPNDNKRVFKCGECSRAYSRVDHLTRHVRTHTNEKPYRCEICSKGFARGDLLKRHAAAHQRRFEESKQFGPPEHGRISRAERACKACSEMHLRCDDTKPCERCQKKNIECRPIEVELEPTAPASSSASTSHECGPTAHGTASEELMRISDQHPYPGYQSHSIHNQTAERQYSSQDSATMISMSPQYEHSALSGHPVNLHLPLVTNDQMLNVTNGWFPMVASHDAWGHRSLLNFGGYGTAYNLNEMDMGLLENYNYDIPFDVQMLTPPEAMTDPLVSENIKHAATLGHDAYRKTGIWRWRPNNNDSGIVNHYDLSLPPEASQRRIAPLGGRKLEEKLDSLTRDKIVDLVASHCNSDNWTALPPWDKLTSSFPSVELLDALIQFALSVPLAECDLLFHLSTLSVRRARPELILALVAFGAILTPDAALGKLGMVLQEVLRQSLTYQWERHNHLTRDLQMAQAYHLILVIGIWSGDSRKTELAEAFLSPAITMQRRANRFRRYQYAFPAVSAQDHGEELEQKWREWIEGESWKRLVHHTAIGDAMQSLVFLTPPLIAYSELVLPLPDSQDLWNATNASNWKAIYLATLGLAPDRPPSLHDCLINVSHLSTFGHMLNDRFLVMGVIGNIWRKIWVYRQDCSLVKDKREFTPNHLAKLDEIKALIQGVRLGEDLTKPNNVIALLFLEISTLHVHMSLDDVQLFAGIEGPDEARRVYPDLVYWSHTQSSREAIWHAGQVLRIAKGCPPATLHAICAIAVYQAALAFWTYGVLLKDSTHDEHQTHSSFSSYIWLDELETLERETFVTHNIGQPVIRGFHDPNDPRSPPMASLSQPSLVMDAIIHIFKSNWDVPGVVMPVLVDNLISLMTGLRAATDKFVG